MMMSISKVAQMMMYDFLVDFRERGFRFQRIQRTRQEPSDRHLRLPRADRLPERAGDRARVSEPGALAKYDQSIGLYDPRAEERLSKSNATQPAEG